MAFAQLTYRESLRDIEACLNAQPNKLLCHGLSHRRCAAPLGRRKRRAIGASMPDWPAPDGGKRASSMLMKPGIRSQRRRLPGLDHPIELWSESFPLGALPFPPPTASGLSNQDTYAADLRGSIPAFIHPHHDSQKTMSRALDQIACEPGAILTYYRGYLTSTAFNRIPPRPGPFCYPANRNLTTPASIPTRPITRGILSDQNPVALNNIEAIGISPATCARLRLPRSETWKNLVVLTTSSHCCRH